MKTLSKKEVVALMNNDKDSQNKLFAEVAFYVRVNCLKKGYFEYFSDQDLDDISNLAYFNIIKGLHTFNKDKSFPKWEHSVILNAMKDYLNAHMNDLNHLKYVDNYEAVSRGSQKDPENDVWDGDDTEPEIYTDFSGPLSAEADEELSLRELESKIEAILPDRFCRIFMMRVNGCKYPEIAEENGISIGYARTIYKRAKEMLKKELRAA